MSRKNEVLEVIFLPSYSTYMNLQDNIWSYLKGKLFKLSPRSCIQELILDAEDVFDNLNCDSSKIKSLTSARKFLV